MKIAPLPKNEQQRLQALYEYDVLDTAVERAYDQLTELASTICHTPIALVSLIDEKRQWFKSHHGLDASETPREIAFCAHAIHHDTVFEIQDSRIDERFHDNPLVTGDTQVIFYAGAPLITPTGEKLGTLCVIDNQPSVLNAEQKRLLEGIAQQVIALLELRKANAERNRLMSQIMALNENLNIKNQELEQFVYSISHDLKAPLITIGGFSEKLVSELRPQLSEQQQHRFERINDNVRYLGSMLNDLLQLSRVMNAEIKMEPFDSRLVIDEQWQLISSRHKDNNIQLKFESKLPVIQANKTLFIQCIDNLLSNAIRYRKKDEPLIITIRSHDSLAYCAISVCDNGIGIEEKYFEKIFNVFEQVNTGAGSGIGLNIVKAAMNRHRGSVHVTSTLGEGSCFELRFPKK